MPKRIRMMTRVVAMARWILLEVYGEVFLWWLWLWSFVVVVMMVVFSSCTIVEGSGFDGVVSVLRY